MNEDMRNAAASHYAELLARARRQLLAVGAILEEAANVAAATKRRPRGVPALAVVDGKAVAPAPRTVAPRDVSKWLRSQGVGVEPFGASLYRVVVRGRAKVLDRHDMLAEANARRGQLGMAPFTYGEAST